jgi:hypothetical protein
MRSRLFIAHDVERLDVEGRWQAALGNFQKASDVKEFVAAYDAIDQTIVEAATRRPGRFSLKRGATMNLMEGTRRLALLLGATGAILGGFASCMELQTVLSQRARHNRFEELANSDVVRQERKSWPLTLRYAPKEAIEALRKLPEGQERDVLRTLTEPEKADLLAKLKCAPSDLGTGSTAMAQENLSRVQKLPGGYVLDAPEAREGDPFACLAEPTDPPTSKVNEGGILTINWSRKLLVESIETEDGQSLYPTPAPSRWLYLLAVILPLLGFTLLWGLVRAVLWVGVGFLGGAN